MRNNIKVVDFEYLKKIEQINNSLDVGAAYSNATVYRVDHPYAGLSFDDFSLWFVRRLKRIIEFPQFLSTTTDPINLFPGQNVLFKICTSSKSSGKIISSIVEHYCPESEVLFKSNSKFMIQKVDTINEVIILKEVSSKCKTDYVLEENFFMSEPELMSKLPVRKHINHDFII